MSDSNPPSPADATAADSVRGETPEGPDQPRPFAPHGSHDVADLPAYVRSLLKIKVPVIVTLASTRQPMGRIVEMGPGAIIHFDRTCDSLLELEVAGHRVAVGEAVKVGEKFGLRVQSVTLPEERFRPVHTPKA
jgi:flagellar motor switch/type III secretory pathway protein FliN